MKSDKIEQIAGYENEKLELLNIRKILHNISAYKSKGVRVPRGIILYGEPGVGKTVMAHAIADETINVVELRAADCCSDDVGAAIRTAFEEAKNAGTTILLLDELDKIAGEEEEGFIRLNKNDDVKKILLQELDSLKEEDDVLVVATCNDIVMLGDVLIRPGRFDKKIKIPMPDLKNREAIIEKYCNQLELIQAFDIEYLARITSGYTGAMIECVINEAGILALEEEKTEIALDVIQRAMNKLAFHCCIGDSLDDVERKRKVATHEAGHVLVALELMPEVVYGASIIKQGKTEGYIRLVEEEKELPSVKRMENEIMILLAGRVAEREIIGDMYLGAESDLRQVSKRTFELITRHAAYGYGFMLEQLGHFKAEILSNERKYQLEQKIEELLLDFDSRIVDMLRKNRKVFNSIVQAMVDKQVLSREEILCLWNEQRMS